MSFLQISAWTALSALKSFAQMPHSSQGFPYYELNCVSLSTSNSCKSSPPGPQGVFGDRTFKEVIKLKEVTRVGGIIRTN